MTLNLADEVNRQLEFIEALIKDIEELKDLPLPEAKRDNLSARFNKIRPEHREISELLHAVNSDKQGLKLAEEADSEFTEELLAQLEKEEAELLKEQAELRQEESTLQGELLEIVRDRANLEMKEEEFWNMANRIEINNIELEEESTFTRQQIMSFNSELDRLSKIYILNEVFDIQIKDGSVPTISKLQMGMLPETGTVDWDSTNAGFGHVMLLLNYLCVRNKIEVPNTEFEILGNISSIKISRKESSNPKVCQLAGYPKDEVYLFNKNEFNKGLVQLVTSIDHIASELKKKILSMKAQFQSLDGKSDEEIKYNQRRARLLVDKLELTEDKLSLPFPINDGKMNADKTVDIRFHKNKLVDWTKGLRFMLIDCKHLITLQNNIDAYELIEL